MALRSRGSTHESPDRYGFTKRRSCISQRQAFVGCSVGRANDSMAACVVRHQTRDVSSMCNGMFHAEFRSRDAYVDPGRATRRGEDWRGSHLAAIGITVAFGQPMFLQL